MGNSFTAVFSPSKNGCHIGGVCEVVFLGSVCVTFLDRVGAGTWRLFHHDWGPAGGGQVNSVGDALDSSSRGSSNKLESREVSFGTEVLQSDATVLLLIKKVFASDLCTLVLVHPSGGWKWEHRWLPPMTCSASSRQRCTKTARYDYSFLRGPDCGEEQHFMCNVPYSPVKLAQVLS